MTTASLDPRIGSVLRGRYRVERKLGHGGMGAVYEAFHLNLEKRVALKVMHPHIGEDVTAVERFRREAIAASRTEHPHIVQVLDMDRAEDGSAFMVMERLDGRDWAAELEETGAQSVADVAHVVLQVLDALEAAHAAGIVHRDLKPENVFLTTQGSDRRFAKVLDFGVSKVLGARGPSTETGTTVGTPYYMSMEQLRSAKDVDARTDLYAVGVMLFRALTDTYPFHADSLPALVAKILTEPPPRLSSVRPQLPSGLDELVAALLSQDRDRRPASARAVADALRSIVGSMGAEGSAAFSVAAPPRPRGDEALGLAPTQPSFAAPAARPRPRALAWGVLAALVAALAAAWLWSTRASPDQVADVPPDLEPSAVAGAVTPSPAVAPVALEAPDDAPRGEPAAEQPVATVPNAPRTGGRRPASRGGGSAERAAAEPQVPPPPASGPAAPETSPSQSAQRAPEPAPPSDLARGFLGGP
jgi:serine/threonine-protein kinase